MVKHRDDPSNSSGNRDANIASTASVGYFSVPSGRCTGTIRHEHGVVGRPTRRPATTLRIECSPWRPRDIRNGHLQHPPRARSTLRRSPVPSTPSRPFPSTSPRVPRFPAPSPRDFPGIRAELKLPPVFPLRDPSKSSVSGSPRTRRIDRRRPRNRPRPSHRRCSCPPTIRARWRRPGRRRIHPPTR